MYFLSLGEGVSICWHLRNKNLTRQTRSDHRYGFVWVDITFVVQASYYEQSKGAPIRVNLFNQGLRKEVVSRRCGIENVGEED